MRRRAGSRPLRSTTVGLVGLVSIVWSLAGFAPAPYRSPILFPAGTDVPRPVQELAWRIIETRCSYQRFELEQRTFWAYDTRATKVDAGIVYSIKILSERQWNKSEPPALIEMTIVEDGRLRLTALRSTFVECPA
jgi:hypothetical protein